MIDLLLALALGTADDEAIRAQVQVLTPAPIHAGEPGELSLVVLEPPARDLPLSLRVEVGELGLTENRFGWSAVVDAGALQPRLRVPFRAPTRPGLYAVTATIDYVVCESDEDGWCRTKHAALEWQVEVLANTESASSGRDASSRRARARLHR